jgi:cytochrome b involved in lipid metabolism
MEEEFKKPNPVPNNFLSIPQPSYSVNRKDRSAKSHLEFIKMMETNKDPLNRQGRPLQNYTIEEVSHHNTENDAWIVINGKVYDMTMYVLYHPGGKIVLNAAGQDGTNLFMKYHPWVNIETIIGKLIIGNLVTYINIS